MRTWNDSINSRCCSDFISVQVSLVFLPLPLIKLQNKLLTLWSSNHFSHIRIDTSVTLQADFASCIGKKFFDCYYSAYLVLVQSLHDSQNEKRCLSLTFMVVQQINYHLDMTVLSQRRHVECHCRFPSYPKRATKLFFGIKLKLCLFCYLPSYGT